MSEDTSESDTIEAPMQTVDLRADDRKNIVLILHRAQAKTTDQARAVHNLRERLDPDLNGADLRQFADGMVEVADPDTAEVQLTDGEVSVIGQFIDSLEEAEQVPTSAPFIRLLDKMEPLIETTKSRGDDSE